MCASGRFMTEDINRERQAAKATGPARDTESGGHIPLSNQTFLLAVYDSFLPLTLTTQAASCRKSIE